ncbi:MAG: hypothetical protein GY854_06285 [Deltaproteobacteria bacterium]|nr:hypothetical protein [Deltaproteobacteria bacterium]
MRQKKQLVPLLLMAFFIAWQTDTVFHLLLVPHMVCEHGKIVDADPDSGRPLHDPQNEDNPNHAGCRFLSLLTSAETRVSNDLPLNAVFSVHENKTFIVYNDIAALHGEELFRLSPSNSPPRSFQ